MVSCEFGSLRDIGYRTYNLGVFCVLQEIFR